MQKLSLVKLMKLLKILINSFKGKTKYLEKNLTPHLGHIGIALNINLILDNIHKVLMTVKELRRHYLQIHWLEQ